MRADCIGAYGTSWASTPNLDALAARGVRFDRHYVNSPQCVPSRCSYLTGVYPRESGILSNDYDKSDSVWPIQPTLPMLFAEAGYRVANVGKSHTPNPEIWPTNHAFTYFRDEATPLRLGDGFNEADHEVIHRAPGCVIISGRYPVPLQAPQERTPATHLTDVAIDWLNTSTTANEPFFLRASYLWPHTPVLAPREFYDLHDPEDMPIPDGVREPVPEYLAWMRSDQNTSGLTEREIRRSWATYHGLVSHVDHQIGRLLNFLKQQQMVQNTVIVFSSDHGCMLGEHGLWHKGVFYEEAVRVPMIINAPTRLPGGRVISQLTEMVDFAPTLFDLADISKPASMSGRSLLPVVAGKTPGKTAVFGEIRFRRFSPYRVWVRTETHAMDVTWIPRGDDLASGHATDGCLFDLERDITQRHNLFDDPAHMATQQKMTNLLRQWFEHHPVRGDVRPSIGATLCTKISDNNGLGDTL